MLQVSSVTGLITALEEFVDAAEAFMQNHDRFGSDSEDVQKVMKAYHLLSLDINTEELEQEYKVSLQKKDLLADYYDSNWH